MFEPPQASTSLAEALSVANNTNESLENQSRQISNAQDLSTNSTYLLTKSDRILRGMGSWGGWAYNTFVMSSSRELDKEIGRTKGEKQTSNTNTHTTTTTGRRRSLESQRLLVTRSGVPYELSGCGDLTMGALESLNNYTQNVLVALEVKGVEESRLMGEVLEGLWVKLSSDLGKAEGLREKLRKGR